ncbi:MAG: Methionine aminopeptidase [Candidatus Beckwithbacteria bacterium GW2011_GWA2_43_10]|uniref:Methionine aminopeptidase n=1 Tax=Candidatus Beckwithbacteria bacterium GW2011_GWA2_43_10 TaxID=1618369 RepID=A0A0G1EAB2_9BACT|nr:MAG: Methionine aminopeptidase [Candidatus Beckwithbacteria bacterium GW2011_GWA2_43_10]
MIIQNDRELKTYQKGVDLAMKILLQLNQSLKPGILPINIDQLAFQLCDQYHVRPAFLGVGGKHPAYQYATCISVNDTAVHGIPSRTEVFKIGDIVKIDFGIIYQGFYTDFCVTVGLKQLTSAQTKLIQVAKKAVRESIKQAIPGNTTGHIGSVIHAIAKKSGFDVLKKYTGHGIGKTLHDSPVIPAHGTPGQGEVFKPGMVVCLEAQLVSGKDQVEVSEDGWSVKTIDHGLVAMFEYMVVVRDKPLVLNSTFDWPIIV